MTAAMTISPLAERVCPGPSPVTVTLPPALDLQSAHSLRCHLLDILQERPTRLVLDMSRLDNFDITLAAILVGIRRRLRQTGGFLQLTNLSPESTALLRQFGLSHLLGA